MSKSIEKQLQEHHLDNGDLFEHYIKSPDSLKYGYYTAICGYKFYPFKATKADIGKSLCPTCLIKKGSLNPQDSTLNLSK